METLTIPMPDGTATAYVARPQGTNDDASPQEYPGVLFFMDAIGLRPQIEEMIERIASWGYVVLAPHVFYRSGSVEELAPKADLRQPGERERFFEFIGPILQGLTTEQVVADIPVYLDTLTGLEGVADGPVGTTGYCMGARLAVRLAELAPDRVAAVGGWHGAGLATDADDSPHRSLGAARAEFVFGHADQDAAMPAEAIERLGQALADAGLDFSNEVMPGAAHGYTMADTSAYDEAATQRQYAELEALFARRL